MNSYFGQRNDGIREITPEQAGEIIDTRKPRGLFYVLKSGVYIGIDNSNGQAWAQAFDDVKHIRPDLSDEKAMEVLLEVKDNHDAEWGVSWATLETVADDLFPRGVCL